MKHVKTNVWYHNGITNSAYEARIMQYSATDISVFLDHIEGPHYGHFVIPVKQKQGYCFKCNKASVANDTGKAADLIDFLSSDFGSNYTAVIVRTMILEQPIYARKKFSC